MAIYRSITQQDETDLIWNESDCRQTLYGRAISHLAQSKVFEFLFQIYSHFRSYSSFQLLPTLYMCRLLIYRNEKTAKGRGFPLNAIFLTHAWYYVRLIEIFCMFVCLLFVRASL